MSKRTFTVDILALSQDSSQLDQHTVTDRQHTITEKELLLHFSTALEVSADSIVVGDLEGKILYANEAAWRGYGAEDDTGLIGKNALDLIAPEERERALTGMEEALKTGRVASQEYHVITRAGALVPVESSTAIICDDQGKAIGFVNVLRNSTERKRAEELLRQSHAELAFRVRERTAQLEQSNTILREEIAQRQRVEETLRESEGRAQALFENASDAIALIALDGTTINVNRGVEILLHHNRSEIIGRSYTDFLTPASLQLTAERFQRATAGERLPSIFELDLVRKDGSTVPVEARTRFLRDHTGAVKGLLGIYRDITARKRTEEALRHSEERYRELFENANDMITMIALDGTFLTVNRKAEQLLGYSREELIGQDSHLFATPASAALGDERTRRVFAGETVSPFFELELVRRDGTLIPVEARIRFMRDDQGKPIGFHGIYRDVTERKQAETKSQLADRIIATMQSFVLVANGEGEITFASPSVERGLGYTIEEVTGRGWLNLTRKNAEEREQVRRQLAATAKGEEAVPFAPYETLIIDKHGTAHWILWQDTKGPGDTVVGTGTDITDRKRAEEALRIAHEEMEDRVHTRTQELEHTNAVLLIEVAERKRAEAAARAAEAEYRSIFENATEGIYRSSIEGRQIRANPALVKLNGYASEEEQIAGVNDIASEWYVDPKRRDEFKRLLAEQERVTDFESEIYRHKTRDRMWISENARLVRDKNTNEPLYYEGTVRDITARKQAEEALLHAHAQLEQRVQERTAELSDANAMLRSEIAERRRTTMALEHLRRQHESILNSAGEGIIGLDLEGKAIFANPEAARLLGREVAEWLGVSPHSLMHHTKLDGTPYPEEECPFRATLSHGETIHVLDEVYWRKDGTHFPVECLSTPIRDEEGAVLGAVITFRDITQRKEVDRMKDELISTVSHELRTPLASLRGFTELMLEREFRPEQQRQFIGVIHKESLRLTKLINDFLDLQRIEAGHFPYTFAPLLVAPLVSEVATVFTKDGGAHALRLDLPASLPTIFADGDRLRQVLSNLLSNAIKFSPKGGEIIVGAQQEESTVMIWVQDQGVGIPEEALAKLFTKFYRVNNRLTRDIGGTGLGLALVKEIITAHKGRVWVESTVGQGSTFFLTIPVVGNEPRK